MNRSRIAACFLAMLFIAATAHASWYDDYDAGVAAARAGNWSTVSAKMSAAIKGNPSENNKARTYGAIFINYHPYYYRGVANLNLGRYEQAISDLERTSGSGPEDLGSVKDLLERAKRQLQAAQTPEPEIPVTKTEPAPSRPEPVRPTPVTPQIDPALRQRAGAALNGAKQKLQQAQQRKASTSPQYAQAMSIYTDATARNAGAKSNEDLSSVINLAGNAGDLADLAMPASVVPVPVVPKPTKPAVALDTVLADYKKQLRRALENYFNGEFEEASRDFSDLTLKLPGNAWVWAFLGASQYSQYAFEADESHRAAALKSFRRAKELRTWKGGLPEKYFSKRIRRAFNEEG
jgi:tetratricopeptide (TPR) repeat protein